MIVPLCRNALLAAAALGLAAGLPPPAQAQFNPIGSPYGRGGTLSNVPSNVGSPYGRLPPVGGYYPPYYPPYYPGYPDLSGGGYLYGAAQVIDAQGRYLNARQEALRREQYKQSRVDTRRRVLEQRLYELSITPKPYEIAEMNRQERVARARFNPPPNEIISGDTLNVLLTDAQLHHGSGLRGPTIPLDPEMLRHINLTAESASGNTGNIGMLKDGGRLEWPMPLQDPKFDPYRKPLEATFRAAAAEAMSGKVNFETVNTLSRQLGELQGAVMASVKDMAMADAIESREFLRHVEEGVNALRNPALVRTLQKNAGTPQGDTVAALIDYMTNNGLKFAPALPGDETYYSALYRSLANYDSALAGVAMRTQPAPKEPKE